MAKVAEDQIGPCRVVRLRAENVKRLKAVEIAPHGNVVRICGKNGAGKSTVIDSIWYALGGQKALPPRPVREGCDTARIELDLGEIAVTRYWTAPDRSYLEVRAANGRKLASPQEVLDAMRGQLFDPLAFTRLEPKRQREVLLGLLGIGEELAAIDDRRAAAYDKRTLMNRDLKTAEAALRMLPSTPPGTPAEPVTVADLASELEAANITCRANAVQRANAAKLRGQLDLLKAGTQQHRDRIAALERELAEERQAVEAGELRIQHGDQIVSEAEAKAAALVDPDTSAITRRMAEIERTNAVIHAARQRAAAEERVSDLRNEAENLTREIDDIDSEKIGILTGAKWPVPGLGFDDTGVLLSGKPFSQGSQAEQLRAAVAIGMAANPRIRIVPIWDGSLLDSRSLAMLAGEAERQNFQLWVEQVDESGQVGIVIEDGEVVAVNAE